MGRVVVSRLGRGGLQLRRLRAVGLVPESGKAWWWIALVGADRPLVLTVEHEMPCPEGNAALDIPRRNRVFGVDGGAVQEFRVTSSAMGVVLPDPAQAFHGLEGERVPVTLDLTWSSRAEVFPYAMTTRYEISSWVTGTVTIGDETIAVDCGGQRDHSWGVRDWWLFPWNWTSGAFADDTFVHAARSIIPDLDVFATGYTVDADGALTPATVVENSVDIDAEKIPDRGAPTDRPRRVHHRTGRPRADPAGRARRTRDAVPPGDVSLHHGRRCRRHRLDRIQLATGLPLRSAA